MQCVNRKVFTNTLGPIASRGPHGLCPPSSIGCDATATNQDLVNPVTTTVQSLQGHEVHQKHVYKVVETLEHGQ